MPGLGCLWWVAGFLEKRIFDGGFKRLDCFEERVGFCEHRSFKLGSCRLERRIGSCIEHCSAVYR